MQLVDARVLITGATGGLGAVMARRFAGRGVSLILSGRRAQALGPLADELGALAIPADLALAQDVARLATLAGSVDVLVANAALPATGRLCELSQEQIDGMLDVNLRAVIALTRALLPGMLERRRGHVVLISSLAGKAASPSSSLYNATKFALRGFGHSLRAELHGSGVGVSLVSPGFIREAGMFADSGVSLPPFVPTRTPRQVADAVLDAVERDRAEVTVAPVGLRLGAGVAAIAPSLAARVQRRLGGAAVARWMADAQASKRP